MTKAAVWTKAQSLVLLVVYDILGNISPVNFHNYLTERDTKRDCSIWGGGGLPRQAYRPKESQKETVVFEMEDACQRQAYRPKGDTKGDCSFWGGRGLPKACLQTKREIKRDCSFWGGGKEKPNQMKTFKAWPKLIWGSLSIAHKKNLSSVPYFGKHEGRSIWHLYGLGRPPKLDRNWFEAH